jgi:hypothetical protein
MRDSEPKLLVPSLHIYSQALGKTIFLDIFIRPISCPTPTATQLDCRPWQPSLRTGKRRACDSPTRTRVLQAIYILGHRNRNRDRDRRSMMLGLEKLVVYRLSIGCVTDFDTDPDSDLDLEGQAQEPQPSVRGDAWQRASASKKMRTPRLPCPPAFGHSGGPRLCQKKYQNSRIVHGQYSALCDKRCIE